MSRAFAEASSSTSKGMTADLKASSDTDRHMAAYARDASLIFVFNGAIVRGWDRLREMQRQWWSDDAVKVGYAYLGNPIVEALHDDAGLTTFLIAARKETADGHVVERTLAYSALWRRLEEGWRIVFAHESSDK